MLKIVSPLAQINFGKLPNLFRMENFGSNSDETAYASRRQILHEALIPALDNREFSLHYQPQFSIAKNTLIGMEALLRWHQPILGKISPAEFIPVAEQSGLIIAIGEWILWQACSQYQGWQKQGLPAVKLAVNLSRQQLTNPNLVPTIDRILKATKMPPGQLQLEITENLMFENLPQIITTLKSLHGLGIKLAIDDFGTGFSSLSVLKHLPIHTLKVDKSFLDDLALGSRSQVILESVIRLGHRLHLDVIAEGVETKEQLCILQSLNCDTAQGYLFSRPLNVTDMTTYLLTAKFFEKPRTILPKTPSYCAT